MKNVEDGSLEVVLRCRRPLASNLEIPIVDATVIDGAKGFGICVFGDEDCGFGRDFGVGEGNERMMRVEQDMVFDAIGSFMLTNSFGSFADVGIDPPNGYVLGGERAFDAPDLGDVTIGDGAIGRNKE